MSDDREWQDTQAPVFVARHLFAKAVWREWARRGFPVELRFRWPLTVPGWSDRPMLAESFAIDAKYNSEPAAVRLGKFTRDLLARARSARKRLEWCLSGCTLDLSRPHGIRHLNACSNVNVLAGE